MSWFNTTPKKPYSARQAMYETIDAKNIKTLKQYAKSCTVDSIQWWDTSEAGLEGEILYLRSRGLIEQHPVVAYLYRLT